MKKQLHFTLLAFVLFTFSLRGQEYRDTIIVYQNTKLLYEYDVSWTKEKLVQGIENFKRSQSDPPFKTSNQIIDILNQIQFVQDPCRNGGFEQGYDTWTGLSLKHSIQTLPIENGLTVNPGIASLPITGPGFGQNHTSIETTGLDPIISVATPSFPLQKTAPGTSGTQSLRLGNDQPGYGSEGVAKRFIVTPDNAKYYFQYAIVMDRSHSSPDGSINGSEVFFIAEAVDMTGTSIDKVVDVGNPTNPFINAVNNNSTYYRNWRCAYLDLSSHIGEEVVIMFINSDCSAGGHKGYTYIDDVCESCENVNEGDIKLDLKGKDCINPTNTYGGNFTLPASGGATNVNISLEIYQSNVLINTITSPTISGTNYTFNVSASDFPDQTSGNCYDLVAKLTFDLVDLNGNFQTVTQYSSKPVAGIQDGEFPGINNDVCFCENNEGSYCCDDENLVQNGNFEAGNTGFSSAYTSSSSTYPGEYDVTTTATNFGANVTDHSFCADPIAYASNNKYMVVNGKTQQSGNSVIWEQTLTGLRKGESYKFCANFKNMPQCTFDILPIVNMEAGSASTGNFTVSTTPSDPCSWQSQQLNFTASGATETIRIILDEAGNGDGNDLVIDDIYVGGLGDPNLMITVTHDGTNSNITGSLNTSSTSDDTLFGKCEYYWYVAEVTSYPSIALDWSTFAYGNNTGSNLPPFAATPSATPWNLTTTYPGYVFTDNKMYIIGLYTPACGCYGEGFTYQLTFNAKSAEPAGLTNEQRQEIIDAILNGLNPENTETENEQEIENKLDNGVSVYPNPAKDILSISLLGNTIQNVEILSIAGKQITSQEFRYKNTTQTMNISNLKQGFYLIKITDSLGEIHIRKIIKD